jgi:hypothetical protein
MTGVSADGFRCDMAIDRFAGSCEHNWSAALVTQSFG